MKILVKPYAVLFSILFLLQSCNREPINLVPDDCLVRTSSLNGQIIPDEYIISYHSEENANNLAISEAKRTFKNLKIAESSIENIIDGEKNNGDLLLIAHLNEIEFESIKTDKHIRTIEPDRILSICSCVNVVAPSSLTWSVRKTGYGKIGQLAQKTAWIIDTGIDYEHPDLNVDNAQSRSFVSGQNSADDINGHGTHVAGIIGAKNNTIGLLGVASDIKLVALKVFDQLGEGRLSSVISAVRHVNANGKSGDVVNMSLGGEGLSSTLEREIQSAAEKGILFSIA
ncbi:MAG: S8 family serine peptidase, partial [Leadbetterella sp.]